MSDKTKVPITVASYWVNDFSKGCSGDSTLSYSDSLAKGFGDAMRSKGHVWKFDCGSDKAQPAQFISWTGADAIPFDDNDKIQGVDTIQFAYLVSHAGISYRDMPEGTPDKYIARMAFGLNSSQVADGAFKLSPQQKNPFAKCLWFNNTAKFGDRNLRWLIVDGCHTCQLPGYFKETDSVLEVDPGKIWANTFYGINMIFGFHDLSTDGSWIDDRGSNFGGRAGSGDALADAWVEEAYSWWTKENPVALACGKTEKEANERLTKDRVTNPVASLGQGDVKWMAWRYKSRTYKS